ncbi:MAG: DUF4157 domain-containing protein [Sporocytophaga sp.]|uniref:eCIS core domain-containing protein n=1 Tax=Sporocytophaga sp. TaxID=2231183 RepID=UPI001B04CC3D|nr:DUF4157 domain-containing protein [Sporocytophaga sp.]MBO9702236.1 DUF4157 domain-containing protein [Sporocytophaga sp.]
MATENTHSTVSSKNNRTSQVSHNSSIYGKAALSGLEHMQNNGYGNSVMQSMYNFHGSVQLKKDDNVQKKEGQSSKENKTNMPDNLKSGIENLSGYSMDDVKVHHNSDKPSQLNAHAYAQGTDIHLGPGQEKHLPHEAWHVVQQKQGRVHSTTQLKSDVIEINDDKGLENEADQMGNKALTYASDGKSSGENFIQRKDLNQSNTTSGIVQRRELTGSERLELEKLKTTAREIQEDYESTKEQIKEIESSVLCTGTELKIFQEKITDNLSYYDDYFAKLKEKEKEAHLSDEKYNNYKKWLNGYTISGGKNKLLNLKKYMKGLPKEDTERVAIPSVFRIADYRILIEKLCGQVVLHCSKMFPLPKIMDVKSDLENLLRKIEVPDAINWDELHVLHGKISTSLNSYPNWKSAIKEQFKELKLVDSKSKVSRNLLDDVGTVNVASRSDKSEGYYMRSQEVHKMNIGKGEVNSFTERTQHFLEENAKVYNVGGAKMMSDNVMVQKELRRGRKKTSSSEFEGLRDDILKHKLKYVKYIVENFGSCTNLKVPQAQLDAEYPCVVVLFEDKLMETVAQSKDNIPEFMTHLIAGHINASLVRASARPLFERRQSFGFMTPTITDVHSGVRLSLGVTPSDHWCNAVIQGIKNADADMSSYTGYKSIPGNSTDTDPAEVVMNKFNQGSVLGAGHKLITEKLLSEDGKSSINKSELNEIFGNKKGEDVVSKIHQLPKHQFDHQEVNPESIELYKRLQAFYESYLKISGNEVEHEEVDWKTKDPGEKLQSLMDKSVRSTYDDSKNVVGMDESSDEEDRDPSRVPSGMSALFLPVAAYSTTHDDKSIVYDTAPFSYFEIDGSWKRTFKLDYIERLGVRYPLVSPAFRDKAMKNFDQVKEEEIRTQLEPLHDQIRRLKNSEEEEVQELQGEFQKFINALNEEKQRRKEAESELDLQGEMMRRRNIQADLVEAECDKVRKKYDLEVLEVEKEMKERDEFLRNLYNDEGIKLEKVLSDIKDVMDRYMICREANEKGETLDPPNALDLAVSDLKEILAELELNNHEGDPARFVARSILEAFKSIGFEAMDKGVRAKLEANVEVAFVDVNPCMTSEDQFDSGENLYHQTMKKYDELRMIVVDITSSTEAQVKELVALFQDQTVDRDQKNIVPFLCLAKSGTKHDQLGLDISTMGRCQYIMHNSFKGDKKMEMEFANLKSASRSLSRNTEPLLVKKMRRDLRKAAKESEGKRQNEL